MRKALLCAALLALASSGCGVIWQRASVKEPAWVQTPVAAEQSGRFLAATGSAAPGADPEQTEKQADSAAREKLASVISEYTRGGIAGFLKAHSAYPPPTSALCQQFITALTDDVALTILGRSVRQDAWREPNGKVHVLYRAAVDDVNQQIAAKTAYWVQHINPFGAASKEATGQMQSFLKAQLEERLTAAARAGPPEGPAEYAAPAWLQAGRHEKYPPEKFFSAIGLGTEPEEAEQSAGRELATRLDASLARLAGKLSSPEAKGALAENLRWLDPSQVTFTDRDLVATRVVERWHDAVSRTHYALAVLDRATAAIVFRHEIGKAKERSASLSISARNQEKAGNAAAALKDYLDALAAASRAVICQLRAAVVVPADSYAEFEGIVPEPVVAQIKGSLQSLLGCIAIEKVSGDRQWVLPDLPPKSPLQVRLTAGGWTQPAAGLPVRLVLEPGAGTAFARTATDADGFAWWQLREPLPATPANSLIAELDLKSICPQADTFRLTVPSVTFQYIPRSRENTYLALHVHERLATGLTIAAPVQDALREALTAEGFRLVAETEILKYLKATEMTADLPDADVLDAFSALSESMGPGDFLLIVVGETEVHLEEQAKTSEGEFYFVRCPFAIRVLDGALPGDEKTVLTVAGTGIGGYLGDEAEAGRRARADAAMKACAELLSGLREKLGPRRPEMKPSPRA